LACGVGVIGLKPERLEEGLILKERQEFVFVFRTAPVNVSKKRCELTDMLLVHVPIQEQSFPILVWWWNRQHRQQVLLRVFKHKAWNRVRGRELWQPAQGHG